MREHYCDGLGDCLPACPHGADHVLLSARPRPMTRPPCKAAQRQRRVRHTRAAVPVRGCARCRPSRPAAAPRPRRRAEPACGSGPCRSSSSRPPRRISTGPTLLIAADCTAYAYAAISTANSSRGKVTLIGCPKLDAVQTTAEKLTEIFARQRHPLRHDRAHGGPLLRRAGDGRKARPPAEWEVPPVARRDRPHRRQHHRRLKQITPEGHSPSGVREFRCAPRLAPP